MIGDLHLRKGGKIKWDCKDGHYLHGKKTGDWKRDEGSIIEHDENCSDLDKMRANFAFGKGLKDDLMKHVKGGSKGNTDKYWEKLDKKFGKLNKEMKTGFDDEEEEEEPKKSKKKKTKKKPKKKSKKKEEEEEDEDEEEEEKPKKKKKKKTSKKKKSKKKKKDEDEEELILLLL